MNKFLYIALAAGILAGCSSNKPAGQDPLANGNANGQNGSSAAASTAGAANGSTDASNNTSNGTANSTATASVYFPFDVDSIQAKDKATIQAQGEYLAAHTASKVRVEGNADERGSSEYNLALGQRRAENTKRALALSGANNAQMETISFGEEKPRAAGHNEEAWAQNRRADIVYK